MIQARYYKTVFHFKNPSGTSRGVLTEKKSWFIEIAIDGITGIGECSIIPGLSPDYRDDDSYEQKIAETVSKVNKGLLNLDNCVDHLLDEPSILFGVETAFLDCQNGGKQIIFDNAFSKGEQKIAINGLIWMGTEQFMQDQIEQKLAEGFTTIKLKIGAIDIDTELKLLQSIRQNYSPDQITLRVDANGAFSTQESINVLQKLAELEIHSIEQPIKAGQWLQMKELCAVTPIPIALDEELIGVNHMDDKIQLLDTIKPQFIILKPSLHGGISGTKEWIQLAEERNIPWWITSALESNVGLNAICQFTAEYNNDLPQGLGTGSLYTDNTESDLTVEKGFIFKKHSA